MRVSLDEGVNKRGSRNTREYQRGNVQETWRQRRGIKGFEYDDVGLNLARGDQAMGVERV